MAAGTATSPRRARKKAPSGSRANSSDSNGTEHGIERAIDPPRASTSAAQARPSSAPAAAHRDDAQRAEAPRRRSAPSAPARYATSIGTMALTAGSARAP